MFSPPPLFFPPHCAVSRVTAGRSCAEGLVGMLAPQKSLEQITADLRVPGSKKLNPIGSVRLASPRFQDIPDNGMPKTDISGDAFELP